MNERGAGTVRALSFLAFDFGTRRVGVASGNTAAAVSLGGALLGFAMPIAISVAVSHNLYAMIGWGVVAGALQLLTYVAARLALPQINQNIQEGKLASGIFLASLSLSTGILNAGCIV